MGRTGLDAFVADLDRGPIVLPARQAIRDIPAVRSDNLGAALETRRTSRRARSSRGSRWSRGARSSRRAASSRFAVVGGPARPPDVGERRVGVHDMPTRHGLAGDAALVTCGGFEPDHGYKAGVGLFSDARDADAVVCATSVVARSSRGCLEDEST